MVVFLRMVVLKILVTSGVGRLRGALLPYGCDKITSGKECVCRNKSLET